MLVIFVLTLIIQLFFVYHVVRSGRPIWWAYLILGFPIVGCLVYYFAELFPGSREHRAARRQMRAFARALNPEAELMRRVERMRLCGSVENKAALAEELVRAGMTGDAVKLYESCVTGLHARDPALLHGLTRALLEDGQFARARERASRLIAEHAAYKPGEVRLLLARSLEGLQQAAAALAEYEALLPGFVGLEARCRYALLLRSLGHKKHADSIFIDVVQHEKRFTGVLESEQQWIALARRTLAEG